MNIRKLFFVIFTFSTAATSAEISRDGKISLVNEPFSPTVYHAYQFDHFELNNSYEWDKNSPASEENVCDLYKKPNRKKFTFKSSEVRRLSSADKITCRVDLGYYPMCVELHRGAFGKGASAGKIYRSLEVGYHGMWSMEITLYREPNQGEVTASLKVACRQTK